MYDLAKEQIAIKKKFEKVSKTMCTNFEYTKKRMLDKYLEMSNKRSATAIARWIVTKNFLEKVYKPGVSKGEIKQLSDVTVKSLKAEVKNIQTPQNKYKRHKALAISVKNEAQMGK